MDNIILESSLFQNKIMLNREISNTFFFAFARVRYGVKVINMMGMDGNLRSKINQ